MFPQFREDFFMIIDSFLEENINLTHSTKIIVEIGIIVFKYGLWLSNHILLNTNSIRVNWVGMKFAKENRWE